MCLWMPQFVYHNKINIEKEEDIIPCRPAPPPPYKRRIFIGAPMIWHHNDITVQQISPTPKPLIQDFQDDSATLMGTYRDQNKPLEHGRILNKYPSEKNQPLRLESSPQLSFTDQMKEKRARIQEAKVNFLKSMDELNDKLALAKE